jgi:type IV pilus assembly protein PilY1
MRVRNMIVEDSSSPADGIDIEDDVDKVIIFGAGYDPTKDEYEDLLDDDNLAGVNVNNAYVDDEGAGLFIINAEDGTLIWKAVRDCSGHSGAGVCYEQPNLRDSIPSDVNPVDTDGDRLIDRVYVGDTGGVVWRADMPVGALGNWTMKPVLSVGRHAVDGDGDFVAGTPDRPDRRFFHAVDVVPTENDAGLDYEALLVGSGNRPSPRQIFDEIEVDGVQYYQYDQFYAMRDYNTTIGTPPVDIVTPDDMADVTCDEPPEKDADGNNILDAKQCLDDDGLAALDAHGWFFDLITDEEGGEKVLAPSLTFAGEIRFSSYVPQGGSNAGLCAPAEGDAETYAVNLSDGSPVYELGTVDSTIMGHRHVTTGRGIPGPPITICLDGDCYVTPGNVSPDEIFRKPVAKNPLRKTFWYESTE